MNKLIERGEICFHCFGAIDENFYISYGSLRNLLCRFCIENSRITRSKAKELVQAAKLCCQCLGPVDQTFYACWCQANQVMCHKCMQNTCAHCNKTIQLERKIYVLDGTPDCMPLCDDCLKTELST